MRQGDVGRFLPLMVLVSAARTAQAEEPLWKDAGPGFGSAGRRRRPRRLLAVLSSLVLVGLAPMVQAAGDEAASASAGNELSNTLKWSTATETENFGYDVYRGESEEGPFSRMTTEVILGAGTSDLPSHYEFVDDTIEPGRTYYYYVESISMRGERERFTPVIKARPKGETARKDPEPPE